MKQHLENAEVAAREAEIQLRVAYRHAITKGNQFAAYAIYHAITQQVKTTQMLVELNDAAGYDSQKNITP